MEPAIEQIVASVVLLVVVSRMAWLLMSPVHHDQAHWSRAQSRAEDRLTRRPRIRG